MEQQEKTYLGLQLHPNKVTIFSGSYCAYCDEIKYWLGTEHEVEFQVAEYDELKKAGKCTESDIEEVHTLSGSKTWPKVFVGTKVIGGHDATKAKASDGSLWKILDEAEIKYKK